MYLLFAISSVLLQAVNKSVYLNDEGKYHVNMKADV